MNTDEVDQEQIKKVTLIKGSNIFFFKKKLSNKSVSIYDRNMINIVIGFDLYENKIEIFSDEKIDGVTIIVTGIKE